MTDLVKSLKIGNTSYGITSVKDCLEGNTDPTASTVGYTGQRYLNKVDDTVWVCTRIVTNQGITQVYWGTTANLTIPADGVIEPDNTLSNRRIYVSNTQSTSQYIPHTRGNPWTLIYKFYTGRASGWSNDYPLGLCLANSTNSSGCYGGATISDGNWVLGTTVLPYNTWVYIKIAYTGSKWMQGYITDNGYTLSTLPGGTSQDFTEWTVGVNTTTTDPLYHYSTSQNPCLFGGRITYVSGYQSNWGTIGAWKVDLKNAIAILDDVSYPATAVGEYLTYEWTKLAEAENIYTKEEIDTAMEDKQDVLTAGTGISIEGTAALSSAVTIVGSPTMTSTGITSGFSDSDYYSIPNFIKDATRSFEIVTAVNMTTAADNSLGIFDSTQQNSTRVGTRITTSATNTVRLRVSTEGGATYPVDITGTTPLTVGTKIWIKATYNSSTGYALYTSTDGSTWTTEGTSTLTTAPFTNDAFLIGDNSATGLSLTGSIYMLDTYTKVDDVINWRAAKVANPVISSTGGGGGSSYTAGTGIAIDSNNVISNTGLINTATGTDSLTVLGSSATDYDATNIGKQSYSGIGGVAVGRTASAGTLSVAVGKESFAYGGNYATAIGGVARATAERAIAVGYGATASASHAIQIGRGSNSTANTMNVGLSSSLNVQLLNSSGNIPAARLSNIYEVVQTMPASPTEGKIYFVTGS